MRYIDQFVQPTDLMRICTPLTAACIGPDQSFASDLTITLRGMIGREGQFC